eukprot:1158310-Pelagomonas_calceolata.AAC.18
MLRYSHDDEAFLNIMQRRSHDEALLSIIDEAFLYTMQRRSHDGALVSIMMEHFQATCRGAAMMKHLHSFRGNPCRDRFVEDGSCFEQRLHPRNCNSSGMNACTAGGPTQLVHKLALTPTLPQRRLVGTLAALAAASCCCCSRKGRCRKGLGVRWGYRKEHKRRPLAARLGRDSGQGGWRNAGGRGRGTGRGRRPLPLQPFHRLSHGQGQGDGGICEAVQRARDCWVPLFVLGRCSSLGNGGDLRPGGCLVPRGCLA